MINDKEFDNRLREMLSGYTEETPDVWGGIVSGLAARKRWQIIRRVSYGVAAAAACVVAGLLIFTEQPEKVSVTPTATATTDIVTSATTPSTPEAGIEAVADKSIASAVSVRKAVKASRTSSQPVVQNVAPPTQDVAPMEDQIREFISPDATAQAPEASRTDVVGETDTDITVSSEEIHLIGEDELPADFWDEDYETSSASGILKTSQINILSNLTTVASTNGPMAGPSGMYAASQSGNRPATVFVEPQGNPHFYAPIALGLQFKASPAKNFYLGAGLSYSYLVTRYDALIDKEYFEGVYNQLHYLGIPVTAYYNFVNTDRLGVYVDAGASIEKCVGQRYVYGSHTLHQKVGGVQFSANVGVGVEFWFVPRVGIYLDPSLVYYFDGHQPLSIRTQQPLQARLELGFRFKI